MTWVTARGSSDALLLKVHFVHLEPIYFLLVLLGTSSIFSNCSLWNDDYWSRLNVDWAFDEFRQIHCFENLCIVMA